MPHRFPRLFVLPAPPAPAAPSDGWIAPAAYLRLRRDTAGLSLVQVAARAAVPVETLRRLETPGTVAERPSLLLTLRRVFPFDPDVYWQLVDRQGAPPRLCRSCGCSHWDSCLCGDGIDLCRLEGERCSRCTGASPAATDAA